MGSTGTRSCSLYASRDVRANSRPRQGSGYLPAGSYRTASSMSRCQRSTLNDETDIAPLPVPNLHLTATTGLFAVLPRAKKFDTSLTITAHRPYRTDRPCSRLMSVPRWTAPTASACAFALLPERHGVRQLLRRVTLNFGYEPAIDMDSLGRGYNRLDQ
jgi:hypothetical protein